eukprot:sb/3465057/
MFTRSVMVWWEGCQELSPGYVSGKAGLLVAEDCDNRPIVDYYGFCNSHVRSQKPEKLPPVDTLTSRQMREVSKVLPNMTTTTKPKLEGSGPGFKPMQPKVSARPLPFHGVHKQDSIIESPAAQQVEGVKREEGGPSLSTASSSTTSTPTLALLKRRSSSETDTADSEDLSTEPVVKAMQSLPEKGKLKIANQSTADHEVEGVKREEGGPSLSTASSSTTSTPTLALLKRRSSSETDTADSEDLSTEPVVKAMQSLPEKGKLKIANQSTADHEASDGAEQYNDLMDLFSLKEKKRKKCKSPESELSDYQPTEKPQRPPVRNPAHKSKRREKKKDPLRVRSLKSTVKSPHKYSHNSYMYCSGGFCGQFHVVSFDHWGEKGGCNGLKWFQFPVITPNLLSLFSPSNFYYPPLKPPPQVTLH